MKILHKHGLTARYLGIIHEKLNIESLKHMQIIIQRVILIKCVKNILRIYMKGSEQNKIKSIIKQIFTIVFDEPE